MEVASITRIVNLKKELKEKISTLDKNEYSGSTFGSENEYTYKGLIAGLDCLLTDITTLTKSPLQFLKISTYNERQGIVSALSNVLTYIDNPNSLLSHLDNLKVAIRPFHIRYTKERLLDFDVELSELIRKKSQFEQDLNILSKYKKKIAIELEAYINQKDQITELASKFEDEYNNAKESNSNLLSRLDTASKTIEEAKSLITKSETIFETIEETLLESEKSYAKIDDLNKNVDSTLANLQTINTKSDSFKDQLITYDYSIKSLKEKAENTIESALVALGYSTAKGLSDSFDTQIKKIEKSKFKYWLVGSAFFLLSTVGIGIWIVLAKEPTMLSIIGRLSITPFTIAGAVFCANQYIRTKNLLDDYSYKLVIAQSIVGFSEQLKDSTASSDEYKDYIRLALEQIHQDPLRKRPRVSKDVDGGIKNGIDYVLETAQKVVNLTKPNEK